MGRWIRWEPERVDPLNEGKTSTWVMGTGPRSGTRVKPFQSMTTRNDPMKTDNRDFETTAHARVAVIGVGGAGNRVITEIYDSMMPVHTIAINTDKDALHERTRADQKVYICKEVLKGEGTRGDVHLGKSCAEIHKAEIRDALRGFDYAFVVTGLGGGTGTGATPVVIDAAASAGCTVFAVAIKPFSFFEPKRVPLAIEAFNRINSMCPAIAIENDLVLEKLSDMSMDKAFRTVNKSIMVHIEKWISLIDDEICNIMRMSRNKDICESGVVDMTEMPLSLLMKA